jgi:putative acetyltransferase
MKIPSPSAPESHPGTTIRSVNWPRDLETVRRLFQDYRQWLSDHRDLDPAAQTRVSRGLAELDGLVASLPGAYGPPRGEVLLAFEREDLVACGALREVEPGVGEIKRLYVREDHRGPGFGHRLTGAMVDRARELGYERVRSYTLPTMIAAIQFYKDLGFHPIPAYWPHPVGGALFFEHTIRKSSPSARPPGTAKATKSRRSRK